MFFLIYELLDTNSNNALFAIRSVIGHYDKFVAALTYLILKNDKVFATSCNNRQYSVARSFQGTNDRKHWSYANTTTCTYYSTEVFYMSRIAKRTYNVCDIIAFIKTAQLC